MCKIENEFREEELTQTKENSQQQITGYLWLFYEMNPREIKKVDISIPFINEVMEEFMTEEERQLLCLYAGLNDGEKRTYTSAGEKYNMPRTKARFFIGRAIRRIRKLKDMGYISDDFTVIKRRQKSIKEYFQLKGIKW